MGLGWGSFSTTIKFDDDPEVEIDMTTVSIASGWLINDSWTLRSSLGLIIDGELITENGDIHNVEPGFLASAGLERRLLEGHGSTPFIDLSLFLGASWTQTEGPDTQSKTDYFAADARLGARAGWSLSNNAFPYVAARIFGGPVNWELAAVEVTGTDVHHYQLALGAAVQMGKVSLYAEWAGLGEKALSTGLSTSW